MVRKNKLIKVGKKVDTIPVQLSYQIIKHFSDSLYTSPNKAIEELVANSYDAWANNVHVIVPDNLAASDATIWVVDDGESMDVDGFKDLWRIGETKKRDLEWGDKGRLPIGKFGIGKLATYVLSRELTHLCKHRGKYRAVSMNFGRLEEDQKKTGLQLDVRQLSIGEAKNLLQTVLGEGKNGLKNMQLFGKGAAKTWTVAAMSSLRNMAKKLTHGRLKRVLRTALPITPQFNLFYCGEQLKSEKITKPTIQEWNIGEKDEVAKQLRFETVDDKKGNVGIMIPQLGKIWGKVQIFEKPLPGGKAEAWGRSHGFFIIVRKRLINLHDELFGLEALSHGAFSRFRMVVYADGLDDYLRATREAVSEDEDGVKNFRNYIKAKFNEARSTYNNWIAGHDQREPISRLVSDTPRSLSREPLVRLVKRALLGEIGELFLTRIPVDIDEAGRTKLLADLEGELEKNEFFQAVKFEAIGIEDGLAVFDAEERCFKLNILHPFFANYCERARNLESFQLLAVAEVLTEAYLHDEGLEPDKVYRILRRRDRFLRELVYGTELSAPVVAQLLEDSKFNSKEFELALCRGMANLGFGVTPIGGPGKPDGLAIARIGVRLGENKSKGYKVTFDAKTSKKDKITAKDANLAAVAHHRKKWEADYALVVAPGYQGDDDEKSNILDQARKMKITLMTLEDFIKLVLTASTRPLGFGRLRDELFETCRGSLDASIWIEKLLCEKAPDTPLSEILNAIWELMEESLDPPKFAAVLERLKHKDNKFKSFREQEIQDWMRSVQRFARDLVTIDGECVYLEIAPKTILDRVIWQANELPPVFKKDSIYSGLLADNKNKASMKRKKKKKQ